VASRASAFRQSVLTRAIKGMRAAGVELARVEVNTDGGFVLIPGKLGETANGSDHQNPWDEVLHAPEQKRTS
jgi:hypothetical protein